MYRINIEIIINSKCIIVIPNGNKSWDCAVHTPVLCMTLFMI